MLLSLSNKFIFIANLKTASTTIEIALRDVCEVRIELTKFGKHDGLSAISQRFAWVNRYVPYEDFFVFGVIREPVDYLLSLYNSHQKAAFDGKQHSTKGMSFDDFLDTWCTRSWQAKPQNIRFTDEHGRLRVTHLVELTQLNDEFPKICERLGIGAAVLDPKNLSPPILKRDDLTARQIDRVRTTYRADYDLLGNRPRQF